VKKKMALIHHILKKKEKRKPPDVYDRFWTAGSQKYKRIL
jgi:hypothetical protein